MATLVAVTDSPYNATGNGTTDDTTAFNSALSANAVVYVPPLTYVVKNVVMNSGNTLYGHAGGPAYDTVNTFSKPRLIKPATVVTGDCFLNVNTKSTWTVDGIVMDGGTNVMDGISDGGVLGNITNCTIVHCRYGFGGSKANGYSSIMRLTSSAFSNCNVGIRNLVDSAVSLCATSTCQQVGVYLGPGASSNNFVAHRSEWNVGYGMLFEGAEDVQVTGGMMDRNGAAGISGQLSCNGLHYTGVLLRRNASNNLATDANGRAADCQMYFSSCNDVVIAGARGKSGANDGGGGTVTPKYFLRFGSGNTNFVLTGSSLSGRTVASISGTAPAPFLQHGNAGLKAN